MLEECRGSVKEIIGRDVEGDIGCVGGRSVGVRVLRIGLERCSEMLGNVEEPEMLPIASGFLIKRTIGSSSVGTNVIHSNLIIEEDMISEVP